MQQYALRPVGHWGTMSRDAMEEAETLVTKAMAATKEKNDFWKSIVEDVSEGGSRLCLVGLY